VPPLPGSEWTIQYRCKNVGKTEVSQEEEGQEEDGTENVGWMALVLEVTLDRWLPLVFTQKGTGQGEGTWNQHPPQWV
jgi:hypothetical protein